MRLPSLAKLEYAVVLTVLGVLAALLLDRLVALEHETEQLEVSLTLRHINIGLKLAIGERLMRGEEARIAELLDRNPLDFLGESQKLGDGRTAWAYDPQQRMLAYRPRQPEAFNGQGTLQWRYTGDRDSQGRMVGLRLERLK